mgnify:CR=1 FL=1
MELPTAAVPCNLLYGHSLRLIPVLQKLNKFLKSPASMANPVFYLRRKFSKGFIISIRLKHRIVSKPFFSFWLFYDPAVANSFKEISFLHCNKGENRPELSRTGRGSGQLVQKPGDVVCIGGPLSGISG